MEKTVQRIKKNITKLLALTLVVFTMSADVVFAANLNLSPASGTYNKNANFSVGVYVSSPDQAMNAVSATVKFPSSLQVVSVSKNGSIVDFWAQEPSFSNTAGEVKLEGVVLTPGYKGPSGKVLTITFKGKSSGLANVSMTNTSVLANDGIGTNILKNVSGATFTIKEVEVKEPEVIKIEDLTPVDEGIIKEEVCEPDSIITSSTHPGVVWRRENSAAFSWDINKDTLASKIAFDKNPDTEPTTINSPAIVEKRFENLEDGIWYFHLALQDNSGWKKTEHFKIKIDHTPPVIEAREILRSDLTDPKVIIEFKVADNISCVKDFEFSINGEKLDYRKLPNGNLELEPIEPGNHELVISAYDRAGNKNEKFLTVVVEALSAPEVTSYPAEIGTDEVLTIKGETIPNGNVEAKVTSKKNNFLIKEEFQSASGRFTFEQKNLKKGIVFVSFRVSDARGAQSAWSVPVEIKVKNNSLISIDNIISSLGIEVAIGVGVFILFLIILITRFLTIRRIKKELGY